MVFCVDRSKSNNAAPSTEVKRNNPTGKQPIMDKTNDYDGFLKLNKGTAIELLRLLEGVLGGKIKAAQAHQSVCQIIKNIEDHIGSSEERKIIFIPLCSLCQEVKTRIAHKLE